MKIAGEIEKQLALEKNETIHGIPYITVVADGSWMKRSYGKAYDSLSGVGAIAGNILYSPPIDTAAMQYGRDQEELARKDLAAKLKKEIKPCGLFIDYEYPYLGASPDGLIEENGLVEIKCPLSAKDLTAEEAIQTLPSLKNIFNKKNLDKMNSNHRYFYQVQEQLNIARRDYCLFALWTPKSLKMVRVDRDDIFWKNQMLPLLTRFYLECMLPELVHSRYNRHMPIREPRHILEAKEAAAKKINVKKSKQNTIESENVIEPKKRFKRIISPIKTITVAAENMEQDDDCVIIGYTSNTDITEDDMARHKRILDDSIASDNLVEKNVLPVNSKINDESLDRLLRLIRETSSFEIQSVQYIEFPHMIVASQSDKSIQIIGGNCSDHWRCIYFDGTKLNVYDSVPNCTYNKLTAKEKNYIQRRYPKISQSDIIFKQVQAQPDGTSCGIYAAAFATTVALRGNPCDEKYSKDVKCMRQHFMKIVVMVGIY
ncbi:hypothetical protein ALC62_09978 [Cyphomyrmex costatus]|uniref:Uncharacterized protein n=1 Tax=Cyphomyrmex costatus TaxID=456900 RepID=A0A151IEN7_9HYME|nr:hypothetical protein ALC62_09978 [Cyphomyrmex costatus]